MVLRRLSGQTENTAPVLTLITQFGGGKTHTLTALYHLARAGANATEYPGVADLLKEAGTAEVPAARVGVFVGNAWDPAEGRETPWIDLARQLAGEQGVAALGTAARTTPPGTEALSRMCAAADGPVLLLFDEVLNFVNRHRGMADSFYSFLQNLTVAVTGTTHAAAVISLPRSQVEMTDWDHQWQERITKVVRRVARDLIAIDESEISEVVRRRLFEDLGSARIRRRVARTCADWCFDRTNRLPAEWLAVDTSRTEAKAKESLRDRFEASYPLHPATLSVFQRKWRALPQFQQTRGALAMLAQWISWAARDQFDKARREPLITLGSAPLHVPQFRAVVLGQLGESRLDAAIEADLAGDRSHAQALDADARGALRDIHRRVGATILFESSGGQVDKEAHLPELRFALGEPEVDTTTIDNAAAALEAAALLRPQGGHRRLPHPSPGDPEEGGQRPAGLAGRGDGDPARHAQARGRGVQARGHASRVLLPRGRRLHPGLAAPGPDRPRPGDGVEGRGPGGRAHRRVDETAGPLAAALSRVPRMVREETRAGTPGEGRAVACLEAGAARSGRRSPRHGVRPRRPVGGQCPRPRGGGGRPRRGMGELSLRGAMGRAGRARTQDHRPRGRPCERERDPRRPDHRGAEVRGAAEREAGGRVHRPPLAARLQGVRSLAPHQPAAELPRRLPDAALLDPDDILRRQIVDFVSKGDFGLASGLEEDGCGRLWYAQPVRPEEVTFEPDVFLLTRARAEQLGAAPEDQPPLPAPESASGEETGPGPETGPQPGPESPALDQRTTLHLAGTVPSELWNRLGTRLLPKLRSADDVTVGVEFSVSVSSRFAQSMETELQQILQDLGLGEVRIERRPPA